MLMVGRVRPGGGERRPQPSQSHLEAQATSGPPPGLPTPGRHTLSPEGRLFPCSEAPSLGLGAWGGTALPDQVSATPWLGLLWFCLQCEWRKHTHEGGRRTLAAFSFGKY